MASPFQRMSRFFSVLIVLCLSFGMGSAQAVIEGDIAPKFSAPSLRDFKVVKLSSLRGKVVYLEFWASWCPPCWDAMPMLEQLHQELKDQGLVVIGVNIDDEMPDARESIEKLGVSFALVRPDDDTVKIAYDVEAMPYGVLIDRKGVVRYTREGMSRSKMRELKTRIEKWLGTAR